MIRFDINGVYKVDNIFKVEGFPRTVTVYGKTVNGSEIYLITDMGRFVLYETNDYEYTLLGDTDMSPKVIALDKVK